MKGRNTVKATKNETSLVWSVVILLVGFCVSMNASAADNKSGVTEAQQFFAKVGELVITQRDFNIAYMAASKNKFYHGKPSESEVANFQREVGEKLIADALLVQEAKRRKLSPDSLVVEQKLEKLDERNAGNPAWQKVREQVLIDARVKYEEVSLRDKLDQIVRDVPAPNEKQLREYYSSHKKAFTAPDQLRVSLIMLKVDPGSTKETWQAAGKFAEDLIKQLKEGADFSEIAKKYSDDRQSAEQGGDMGYLHGGMLGGLAEQAVLKLKPGELTDVVSFMEGVGILKLTEHKIGKLNDFNEVKARIDDLWRKEEGERQVKVLIAQLRKGSEVYVNDSLYIPIK